MVFDILGGKDSPVVAGLEVLESEERASTVSQESSAAEDIIVEEKFILQQHKVKTPSSSRVARVDKILHYINNTYK